MSGGAAGCLKLLFSCPRKQPTAPSNMCQMPDAIKNLSVQHRIAHRL